MLRLMTMKASRGVLLGLLLFAVASCSDSDSAGNQSSQLLDDTMPMDIAERIDWIHDQIAFIQAKAKKVNDSARLQYTNVLVERVQGSIKELGLVKFLLNQDNTNRLHALVRELDNSQGFFNFIRTEETDDVITSLLLETVSEDHPSSLMVQIGYRKRVMGTITYDHVTIMYERLQALRLMAELPEALREKLERPIATSGFLVSLSSAQGDRPVVHAKATELTKEIDLIYPLFDECLGTVHLYEVTQTIRGVNEFLKDYLQVEAMKKLESE